MPAHPDNYALVIDGQDLYHDMQKIGKRMEFGSLIDTIITNVIKLDPSQVVTYYVNTLHKHNVSPDRRKVQQGFYYYLQQLGVNVRTTAFDYNEEGVPIGSGRLSITFAATVLEALNMGTNLAILAHNHDYEIFLRQIHHVRRDLIVFDHEEVRLSSKLLTSSAFTSVRRITGRDINEIEEYKDSGNSE